MKKALIITIILAAFMIVLTGCNYDLIDTQFQYNYAYIELPDGQIVEGKVESWTDYEGEQLQVKINGTIYLTSSYHCTLIYDPSIQ